MIPTAATLLLASADPGVAEVFRAAVERLGGVRMLIARSDEDARTMLLGERPNLVVAAAEGPGAAALALGRRLHDEEDPAAPQLVLMTGPAAPRADALEGIEGFLNLPPSVAEVMACLRGTMRLRRLESDLAAEAVERKRLQAIVDADRAQWLELLKTLLDMSLPGALERSRRLAGLALALAERFEVPERLIPDLEVAAQLHELGKIANPGRGVGAGEAGAEDWQYTQCAKAILSQTKSLEGAAELVGGIYENWDGTGAPDHLQQGQIPLRCRILRALIDLMGVLGDRRGLGVDEAVAELAEHVGTRYDPMVVVHLRGLLGDQPASALRDSRLVVPIADLRAGMVLAEDLFTSSGLKLLARETALTGHSIEAILRRHRADPILRGASVYRASA